MRSAAWRRQGFRTSRTRKDRVATGIAISSPVLGAVAGHRARAALRNLAPRFGCAVKAERRPAVQAPMRGNNLSITGSSFCAASPKQPGKPDSFTAGQERFARTEGCCVENLDTRPVGGIDPQALPLAGKFGESFDDIPHLRDPGADLCATCCVDSRRPHSGSRFRATRHERDLVSSTPSDRCGMPAHAASGHRLFYPAMRRSGETRLARRSLRLKCPRRTLLMFGQRLVRVGDEENPPTSFGFTSRA